MTERNLGLTFAGGGNRAFLQLGLLARWGDDLLPRTAAISACSAGACAIVAYLANRVETTNTFWKQRRDGVTRNLDVRRALRGEPMAPHGAVYRDTVLHSLADGGFARIQALPFPVWILTASMPAGLPTLAAVSLGLSAYNLEKKLAPERVHPTFGARLGFRARAFDARACSDAADLADLIMASSAVPPFTPVGAFRGFMLLDGGMIDNAPAFLLEREPAVKKQLVLLTRPYPQGPTFYEDQRMYVAPTAAPPIDRWDYTRPHLLDETIALGEREAESQRPALDAFLHS